MRADNVQIVDLDPGDEAKVDEVVTLLMGAFAQNPDYCSDREEALEEVQELFDLGGNVAEYAQDGSTYGYSAYDYVDPFSLKVERHPGHTGFRVVLEPERGEEGEPGSR